MPAQKFHSKNFTRNRNFICQRMFDRRNSIRKIGRIARQSLQAESISDHRQTSKFLPKIKGTRTAGAIGRWTVLTCTALCNVPERSGALTQPLAAGPFARQTRTTDPPSPRPAVVRRSRPWSIVLRAFGRAREGSEADTWVRKKGTGLRVGLKSVDSENGFGEWIRRALMFSEMFEKFRKIDRIVIDVCLRTSCTQRRDL